MIELTLEDTHIVFEKNKLYCIPRMQQYKHSYYCFQVHSGSTIYGTCLGFNSYAYCWEFETYPDKKLIYIKSGFADECIYYGIYELESEDEMIMLEIK